MTWGYLGPPPTKRTRATRAKTKHDKNGDTLGYLMVVYGFSYLTENDLMVFPWFQFFIVFHMEVYLRAISMGCGSGLASASTHGNTRGSSIRPGPR